MLRWISGVQTPPAGITPFPKEDVETEAILRDKSQNSGITYAVVAYNWWMDDMVDWIRSGCGSPADPDGTKFLTTANEGKMAYVSKVDYARACAAALARSDIEVNVKYEVSGPESIPLRRVLSLISDFLGKQIQIIEVLYV